MKRYLLAFLLLLPPLQAKAFPPRETAYYLSSCMTVGTGLYIQNQHERRDAERFLGFGLYAFGMVMILCGPQILK